MAFGSGPRRRATSARSVDATPLSASRRPTRARRSGSVSFAQPAEVSTAGRVASVTSYRRRSGRSTVIRWKPKRLVREDLHPLVLLERAVEAGDLGDLVGADLVALVAQALPHLREQLAGIDELDLAPALGLLAVGDDPEVGADPGVVEELVGQGDDPLEPVVLDDPAPDLALARARAAGEERRAVEDDGEPPAALLGALQLADHVLEEEEASRR